MQHLTKSFVRIGSRCKTMRLLDDAGRSLIKQGVACIKRCFSVHTTAIHLASNDLIDCINTPLYASFFVVSFNITIRDASRSL